MRVFVHFEWRPCLPLPSMAADIVSQCCQCCRSCRRRRRLVTPFAVAAHHDEHSFRCGLADRPPVGKDGAADGGGPWCGASIHGWTYQGAVAGGHWPYHTLL